MSGERELAMEQTHTFELPLVTQTFHILMIAPQPWFQPRGTPFSVLHRIKALTLLGHDVDLVTYAVGQDVPMPRLRIFRAPAVPFAKNVRIGPSVGKIFHDLMLYRRVRGVLRQNRYDLLHTHEEASFFGHHLAKRYHLPHLYDMHSSLPQQLRNFRFSRSKMLYTLFERLEHETINHANAVITICPELQKYVESKFPDKPSFLIENVADNSIVFPPSPGQSASLRRQYGLEDGSVVLYYGTLEAYQGIPLLLESARKVCQKSTNAVRFLIVGGQDSQVAEYRRQMAKQQLSDHIIFTGFVQPQLIPAFIELADVLVSPRVSGSNSPLKIYSYLRSGKPVVATRHITHTQILTDRVAILVDPEHEAFAEGILRALQKKEELKEMTRAAAQLAEEKYGYSDYLRKTQQAVERAVGKGTSIKG